MLIGVYCDAKYLWIYVIRLRKLIIVSEQNKLNWNFQLGLRTNYETANVFLPLKTNWTSLVPNDFEGIIVGFKKPRKNPITSEGKYLLSTYKSETCYLISKLK